ncbi:type I-E CRISPR-associated protein Cas5/CasD [Paracoccus sp. MKU1]|uniref:type I-E CRISPR-associated protein Cas5/CasD n=1 Tax=Paracoccus sp. MKU1 TaxID=1745182 RepID=UPI000719145F|nr:type I-E CRISPR-associated protein Cas5/CasD [Paracoccus sp. MKU1]KRW97722.1 type I-E CRISPR-associated protein Cas5/CasD [Paracoccus sp. MKU1]
MMHRWLHLRLTAPLLAFGGVAVDQVGPTRDFPSASALTGLLANALGLRREDWQAHQTLQDRLIFGAVNARQGRRLTDNQNAKLEANDRGWTTWGSPDQRAGASYDSPHRRRRDYLADHDCHVVLRLADDAAPDLDHLAAALDRPARPLFLGRKPCLPSGPLLQGLLTADTVRAALTATGQTGDALWPAEEGSGTMTELADLRIWRNGYHAGSRRVGLGRTT